LVCISTIISINRCLVSIFIVVWSVYVPLALANKKPLFASYMNGMTLAEINRMIRAAIRAARQEGAPVVEVKIGDGATVRIPLVPEKLVAESDEVVL